MIDRMTVVRKILYITGVLVLFIILIFLAWLVVSDIIVKDFGRFGANELLRHWKTGDTKDIVENHQAFGEMIANKYVPPAWMCLLMITLQGVVFVITGFLLEKKDAAYYALLPALMYLAWIFTGSGSMFSINTTIRTLLIILNLIVNIVAFYCGRRIVNRYAWHSFCAFV